jgi:uroporphyrinogen-III synthase
LITRTRAQASVLAELLEAAGAETVLVPTIELAPPTSFAVLDGALRDLLRFDTVLFTSANAVHAMAERAREQGSALCFRRIAVIGPATAKAVIAAGWGRGFDEVLIPDMYVAESLAETLLTQAGGTKRSYLLVRAEEARDILPASLEAAGHHVIVAPAYRNLVPPGTEDALQKLFASPESQPDMVTFTSSSTARNLFALLDSADIRLANGIALASIGPITSATLRELGHEPTLEATEPSVEALAAAIIGYLRATR